MYKYVKRVFDTFLSIALIIVLGIPMLIIACLIKLEDVAKLYLSRREWEKT